VPAYLVFEPAGQTCFAVYSGNAGAVTPRYESSKVLASLDSRILTKCTVTLAAQTRVAAKSQPGRQRFVWAILAAAVLFTAWMLLNTARSIGKEKSA
jgi:hypothetical protein